MNEQLDHSGGHHRRRLPNQTFLLSLYWPQHLSYFSFFLPFFTSLPWQPILCARTDQWHLCTKHHIFNTNSHLLPIMGYFIVGSYPSQKFQAQLVRIKWAQYTTEMWPILLWAFHDHKLAATAFKAVLLLSVTTRKVFAIDFLSTQRQHVS